jgi:hypothetical protein
MEREHIIDETCRIRTVTSAGKRPALAHQSGLDMNLRFPNPWQQILETVDGVTIDHPCEHVGEVSIGFDPVEFAGFDQRTDDCPAFAASIAACEQVVLAAKCHRADRALDRVRALSAKLLKNGKLKTYEGYPHGMLTTHPEVLNADILAFIRS